MATSGDQLLTIIISLTVWATIVTVMLFLARRDVKLGLKKWVLKKLGKEPIIIRYHGPNKHVREMVIATRKLGESIEIRGRKMLILKDKDGETFFLDPSAIRRRDDDLNEITYNFNTIMPADPSESEEMVLKHREEWLVDVERFTREHTMQGRGSVPVENLTKYTDPKRLNKFIEFVYLAAKADALKDATTLEKWVKVGTLAAIAAVILAALIYYNLDAKIIPFLQQIFGQLQAITGGLTAGGTTPATGVL